MVAGCANPGDSPEGDPLITVTEDGFVRVVSQSGYAMDFSPTGIKMPLHLRLEDEELLATGGCNTEGLIGIGLFPALVATAGDHGEATTSEIEVLLDGPVIAKVRVEYTADYLCPDTHTLTGETFFTFFPGGRIVRQDRVTPSATPLGLSTTCGCQDMDPPQNLFFTTFYAFDPDGAAQVDADGVETTGNVAQACTMYPDRAVGVSWSGSTTRIGVNGVSSHVFDWASGESTLAETEQTMISAIQLAPDDPAATSDCRSVLAPLADPQIKIGDAPAMRTAEDGIYRLEDAFLDTPFEITTVDEELPPGFAVSVNLDGATHAEVSRDPEFDSDFFFVQREDDEGRFLFVFPDGLGLGERITIEPKF